MSTRPPARVSFVPIPKRRPTDAFQQIGDIVLYDTGSALLGNRVFSYRTAIDDFTFSEGFVARRRIEVPQVLIVDSPGGEETVLFYDVGRREWSQVAALDDFRFEKASARYGPWAAAFFCDPGLPRRLAWCIYVITGTFLAALRREELPAFLVVGLLCCLKLRKYGKRMTLD